MQETGRTLIGTQGDQMLNDRQSSQDRRRETKKSLMLVVAKATDVTVKKAPLSHKGELPHSVWDYHEKIPTGRRQEVYPE